MSETKDVLRPTDAEAIRLARTLLRTARHGALAVLSPEGGAPLASRVGVATTPAGAPLILVSMLAAHTRALLADPRCSLLLGEPGKGDPLAHPRVTLACRAQRLDRGSAEWEAAERRYLGRQPKARLYAGLGDFHFFRLDPEGASLNGGFGKAYALGRADLLLDGRVVDDLARAEPGAVEHMNDDHADAVALIARHFGRLDGDGWTLCGLDPEGLDLLRGDELRRVFFPAPLTDAAALRPQLVAMTKEARAAAQG